MTLDEAIKDLEHGTKQLEMEIESGLWIKGSKSELCCKEGIALNKQHIEWLTELKDLREENKVLTSECDRLTKEKEELNKLKEKAVLDICRREARLREAKRLLKAAVEDLNVTVAEVYNGGVICECCKWESQIGKCSCPNDGGCDTDYQWRYADEAKKLLNDEK